MAEWTFVTNHAVELSCVAKNPRITAREMAIHVGITERADDAFSSVKSGLHGGRFASEWVVGMDRNQWPLSIGIVGRLASEYAATPPKTVKRLVTALKNSARGQN